MRDSKDFPHEQTEIESFEFSRRWDEVYAIIDYSFEHFGLEHELKEEMKKFGRRFSSPWLWLYIVVVMVTSLILREASWYEFSIEWNFASFLWLLLVFWYVRSVIAEADIKKKNDSNFMRLKELNYRWNAITGGSCGSFWELRQFINSEGELEKESFKTWRDKAYHDLREKMKYLSDQN